MVRYVKAKLSHKSPLFENLKTAEKCSFQLLATSFRCADRLGAGWCAAPDPESRDSGFDASHRPGMTVLEALFCWLHFQSDSEHLAGRTDQAAAHTLLSGRDAIFLDPCQRDGCQLPVSYGNVGRMSALRPKAVIRRPLRRIPIFPKLELFYREVPGE